MAKYTDAALEEIAEYYKTHTGLDTAQAFGCSINIVKKASSLFDVVKIPCVNRVKKKSRVIERAFVAPPEKTMWKPPTLAANQHEVFVGKS